MRITLGGNAPHVDEGAWLAPNATVAGQVVIERGASVWYGAVLRADGGPITVGSGSNIQDNCVLHTDEGLPIVIGRGVSVGHGAVIHGATIGDGVLVGMGAVVLNGAVVGRESMVAAGALIPAGTEIPARSLVAGVPGRVRRPLSNDEVRASRANAENYEALSAVHRSGVQAT